MHVPGKFLQVRKTKIEVSCLDGFVMKNVQRDVALHYHPDEFLATNYNYTWQLRTLHLRPNEILHSYVNHLARVQEQGLC